MNVLLVDDEALARRRLRRLLAEADDVTVVAECGSGGAAIEALGTHQVDLVFLDIQMPGVDGFVVAESLQGPEAPLLVFVTAHDSHAIRAFETRALDYLLSPYGRSDSASRSTARARRSRARRSTAYARQLRSVIAQLDTGAGSGTVRRRAHRADRRTDRSARRRAVRYVATADVAWAEAKGPHVLLHTRQGVFEIRETLARLEASLDARRFVRIHRSFIVNLSQIKELQPWFGGDAVLVLHGGQQLKVSDLPGAASAAAQALVRGSGGGGRGAGATASGRGASRGRCVPRFPTLTLNPLKPPSSPARATSRTSSRTGPAARRRRA